MNSNYISLRRTAAVAALLGTGMLCAFAAPVSPEDARADAARFLSVSRPGVKAAPADPGLTLAYTADAGDAAAFYIFNHNGGGFIIMTADDRLPAVLGYSDNGNFDPARTPDNMKWWLGEYTREISGWLPSAPENLPVADRMKAPVNRPAIAPLTKTTWNQDAPYNNSCPIDPQSGTRSVTGCVATAMAQLMKFHSWPLKPQGSSGGVVFDGTYDWRNMLDNYEPGKYSGQQAAAVSKLMRQCGAAVNMQYSSWASGAYDMDVPFAFAKYFSYDPSVEMVWKDYTPQSKWNSLVYDELAAGRPLYYSGASNQGGHAFVCDGYSENEYFHFNWGWGGYQDGYFRLTALNPASGGAGSYEGGYNSGQIILINLKPAAAGSSTQPVQNALLSTGGFYYVSDGLYEIQQDPANYNMVYNPLAYSQTLTVGLKFTDLDHPDVAPKYTSSGSTTLKPQYGFTELKASTPSLPDGNYGITPVFNSNGSDWRPIPIPLGKQNYVHLTVQNGQKTYSNVGPDDSNKPCLLAEYPISTPVIYGNSDMAFSLPIINVGQGDYMGSLGFTLVQKDSDFGDSVSLIDSSPIAGNSYHDWEVRFNEFVAPGEYELFVQDDEANFIIDAAPVTIVDGSFPKIVENAKVNVEALAPNFITSERENPIYFSVESKSIFEEQISFRFTLLNAETLQKISDMPFTYTLTVPANYYGRVTVAPRDLGVNPGTYLWYVSDTDGNALCTPTPLIVTSPIRTAESGICYVITDEAAKKATVVAPEGTPYSGEVAVPASIDGYKVTAIRNDAFAFSTAASVTLPSAIKHIPTGAFYGDWRLENLTLHAREVATQGGMAFNPKYVASCWLYVPDFLSNLYARNEEWLMFRMCNWTINLNDVELESGLLTDPATGAPYAPYYVNLFARPELKFKDPNGLNILIDIVKDGETVVHHVINPRNATVPLPALGQHGTGILTATATTEDVGVEGIAADDAPADVFSIDGRLMLRSATPDDIRALPAGLYIVGGRKVMVNRQ